MISHKVFAGYGLLGVKSAYASGWGNAREASSRHVYVLGSFIGLGGDGMHLGRSTRVFSSVHVVKDEEKEQVAQTKESWIDRIGWGPQGLKVGKDFNRWKVIPAATMNHLCLGSVFAWSIFNQPLMRLGGVVAPAANDWALGDVSVTFSLIMGGFVWGAVFGKKLDEFGPRVSCLIGATSLGAGFSLASLAVATHNLPLLYLGGAIWGISNGWAYVPPVSTLVKWFPDRKGFASGVCVLGYGGGAMVAAPLFSKLIEHFRVIPEYAGPVSDLDLVNKGGELFVETSQGLREVVVATATDLQTSGLTGLADAGAYFVGTGSTGVAEAFGLLGLGYGAIMAASAFAFRLPPDGYTPPGMKTENTSGKDIQLTTHNVAVKDATRSPQFWLLYAGFGTSITGAYGLISSGKLMMTEAFGSSMPELVTAAFTSTFVAGMSAANLTGRVVFPTISDTLGKVMGGDPFHGRRYTYTMMWVAAPFLYGGILWSIHTCAANPSVLPLAVYTGSVLGILSIFGGCTANRPAIVADIFGLKNMGVLTARQLSVVLPAAFTGPQIVAYFRKSSTENAIHDISSKVDDSLFQATFGAGKDAMPSLIESKTVTIPRLLEIAPHVPDPTPYLYDTSMMIMGGFQIAALCTNLALRPVASQENK